MDWREILKRITKRIADLVVAIVLIFWIATGRELNYEMILAIASAILLLLNTLFPSMSKVIGVWKWMKELFD